MHNAIAAMILCLCAQNSADVPISVKITRQSAYTGKWVTQHVYINDRFVGKIDNNETQVFDFGFAKLGKNTLRIEDQTIIGKYTFYSNLIKKNGGLKHFLVTNRGDQVFVKHGFNDNDLSKNFYEVSREVAEDWRAPEVIAVKHVSDLEQEVLKRGAKIKVRDNVGKVVKDTLLLRHSATISDSWKTEEQIRKSATAGWFSISSDISKEIQRTTHQTFETEKATERSVTITPRKAEYVRVVWINLYRTGTVTFKDGGKEVTAPFRFLEDFDLVLEDVE